MIFCLIATWVFTSVYRLTNVVSQLWLQQTAATSLKFIRFLSQKISPLNWNSTNVPLNILCKFPIASNRNGKSNETDHDSRRCDATFRKKKTENCKYALCIIPPKTCYITLALNRFSLSIFTHGHCCIRDGLNFNVQHLLREPQSFKRNSNRWNRWSCNWLETVNFITNRDEWARFRSTTKWKLSEMAGT